MKLQVKYLTLLVLGLVLVFGAQILSSCKKEPIPIGPEELQPTLVVSKTPEGVLPYGSKVKIIWRTTNTKSLTVNGVRQGIPTSDSIVTERLFESVLFEIKATNITLSVQKEIEVHTGDWTTSKFGLVSYYPWRCKVFRVRLKSNGTVMSSFLPEGAELSYVYSYHKNGVLSTNYLPNPGTWSISEDGKFLIRDGASKSFSVDDKELITYQETTWEGQPALFENVFEHASNIPTDK